MRLTPQQASELALDLSTSGQAIAIATTSSSANLRWAVPEWNSTRALLKYPPRLACAGSGPACSASRSSWRSAASFSRAARSTTPNWQSY